MAKFVNIKTQLNTIPINEIKKPISVLYKGSSACFTCKVGGDFKKLSQVYFCFYQGDTEYKYSAFTILNDGQIEWNEYSSDGVQFNGTYDKEGNIIAVNLIGNLQFTNLFYENDKDDLMEYEIIVIYNIKNAPVQILKQPSILVINDGKKQQSVICSEDLLCSEELYCSNI